MNRIILAITAAVVLVLVTIVVMVMTLRSKQPRSRPVQQQVAVAPVVEPQPAAPVPMGRVKCPDLRDGERWTCEYGEAGTEQTAMLTRQRICQNFDSNTRAYFTPVDGDERLWTGSDADRDAVKRYWRWEAVKGRATVTYFAVPPEQSCP